MVDAPSDSAQVNGQIETRFVRELMGFHITFFSLLGIAVVHAACSLLWWPVKNCLRRRNVARHRSDNESPGAGPEGGVLDDNWPLPLRAMGPDKDGDWQAGPVRVEHVEVER